MIVLEQAPSIGYNGPFIFVNNTEIVPIEPTNNGGPVNTWIIISGSMPQGLIFENSTGIISGTPISGYITRD